MIRDGALRIEGQAGRAVNAGLAVRNKAYDIAKAMREKGRRMPLPEEWLTPGVEADGWWALPRLADVDGAGVEDRTVLPAAERLTTSLALRDYQRGALATWWRGDRNGLIEAPCGAGKTAIGSMALAVCEAPGLVIVHTKDLLRQWVERLAEVGMEAVSISDGGDPVVARIVVATMQTVGAWDSAVRAEWGQGFGLVVADEVHHAPCATMGTCLMDLPGRWRLGLTATPTRVDGLTPWIHAHIGPTVAKIPREVLIAAGRILVPAVRRMPSGWEASDDDDYTAMVTAASQDEARTARILEVVVRAVAEGRHVMVLTERKAHAKRMGALLAEAGVVAVVVTGDVAAKKRAGRLDDAEAGRARVLIATQLADEGLDMVTLDTLVLAVPQKHAAKLEQRVGRIARPSKGKPAPEVWDFTDGGWAGKLWWARRKVYTMLGCAIVEG